MFKRFKPKTEFQKNLLTLVSGTFLGQVIIIAISPILTRLFGPEDFGVYAIYLSLVSIFSVVVSGRYEYAIMLPVEEKNAAKLWQLCFFLTIVVSIFILLIIIVFNKSITSLLAEERISFWLYFVPIAVFLTGSYQSYYLWFTRKKEFKLIARASVTQAGSGSAFQLLLGFFKSGPGGLVIGNLIGLLGSFLIFLFGDKSSLITKKVEKQEIKKQAVEYKKFPQFDALNVLFHIFSVKGINVLFGKFFGAGVVGFYAFTDRILLTPFTFFTAAFSQAFYEKLTHTYNNNRAFFNELVNITIGKMILIITIPFIVVVLSSKYFIPIVFGENWSELYRYIYILAPPTYLTLILSPQAHVLKIFNLQNVSLYINFWLFFNKFLAIFIAVFIFKWGDILTLLLFSFVSFLCIAINSWIVFKKMKMALPRNLIYVFTAIGITYILLIVLKYNL